MKINIIVYDCPLQLVKNDRTPHVASAFSVQYCQLPAPHHRGGNLLTVDLKER